MEDLIKRVIFGLTPLETFLHPNLIQLWFQV